MGRRQQHDSPGCLPERLEVTMQEIDLSTVGLLAARVMERAVVAAVVQAGPLCGLPCHADLLPES